MKSGILTRSGCKGTCAASLLLLLLLSACTGTGVTEEAERRIAETGTRFSVAPVLPCALVDQNGYRTGGEKIVIFRTETPDELFEVRSADDDSVVYTGSIHATDASGISIGQFSAFQTDGTYYVYADSVGSSFGFRIEGDLIEKLYAEALSGFRSQRSGAVPDAAYDPDVVSGCHAMRDLLLSYELNPDRHGDDTGIPESGNGIPDLLDEVRYEIDRISALQTAQGTVHAGLYVDDEEGGDGKKTAVVTPEAAAAFAETNARFAFVYEMIDPDYAEEILNRAKAAWIAFSAQRSPLQDAAAFSAAAELYRITGEKKYENVLSAWFQKEEFAHLFATEPDVFYGSVTYIHAKQPVNVAVRDNVRELLITNGTQIAQRAAESAYFVSQTASSAMLEDMGRLAVANSVIYNHAYTGIIENHIHYLAGRNPEAINYLNEETDYTYRDAGVDGVLLFPENSAKLVLMTGGI